jgi:uncharacterized protein (TIGR04552 family)
LDETSLTIDTSLSSAILRPPLDLQDMEAARLLLHGDSVVDWQRLDLDTLEKVDRFLSLHLVNVNDPLDQERLRFVFNEAVHYLEENLGLTFPKDIRDPDDVRKVFLWASRYEGFRRRQLLSCVILKVMHVINHLEAADLRFQTSVSEARLIELTERRILALAERMRREGFPLVAFYGSRKTRNSVITKLIAKKETIAATIFDKLRFRIVTGNKDQILPAICWLTRNVFPFNYVIPGQSHNNLFTLHAMTRSDPRLEQLYGLLQTQNGNGDELIPESNPFSGSSYEMINFIVDFPVRIDRYVRKKDPRNRIILGRTAFVLVELQIIDAETAARNEEGENAHGLYKIRKRRQVEGRLKKGAFTI